MKTHSRDPLEVPSLRPGLQTLYFPDSPLVVTLYFVNAPCKLRFSSELTLYFRHSLPNAKNNSYIHSFKKYLFRAFHVPSIAPHYTFSGNTLINAGKLPAHFYSLVTLLTHTELGIN